MFFHDGRVFFNFVSRQRYIWSSVLCVMFEFSDPATLVYKPCWLLPATLRKLDTLISFHADKFQNTYDFSIKKYMSCRSRVRFPTSNSWNVTFSWPCQKNSKNCFIGGRPCFEVITCSTLNMPHTLAASDEKMLTIF